MTGDGCAYDCDGRGRDCGHPDMDRAVWAVTGDDLPVPPGDDDYDRDGGLR